MTKKTISLTLCSLFFATCSTVQAQQVTKIPRIGIVTGIATDPSSRIKIFRQELQELGYFEGKNILFEYRNNEGDRSRVPGIVAELVRLKVDIHFLHTGDRHPRSQAGDQNDSHCHGDYSGSGSIWSG